MIREIKCEYWKVTNTAETMKILCNLKEEDLVPGINEFLQEEKTPMPNPYDPLPMHIIPYEVESVRTDENIKSSELT